MAKTKVKKKTSSRSGSVFRKPKGMTKRMSKKDYVADREKFWKDLQDEEERDRSGGDYFNFPKGTTVLRFVTFEHDDERRVFVKRTTHWRVIPGNRKSRAICPGEDCPLCELEDTAPASVWKNIAPQTRYMANAVVRTAPDMDGENKPVICQGPKKVKQQVITLANRMYKESGVDIFDLQKGYDVKVTREGTGFDTEYNVELAKRPSALEVKTKVVDLDALEEKVQMPIEELAELASNLLEGRKRR